MKDNKLDLYSHECYIKLKAVFGSLKTAELKAANLLIERPEFIKVSSITEAAVAAGCSEATFVRLSKRMGYSGFPELKYELSLRENKTVELYDGILPTDDYITVFEKVFKSTQIALNDTMKVVDEKSYYKAVEAILNANKIVFCGNGDAVSVARSAYQKFLRAGLNVEVSNDVDIQLIHTSFMDKRDVLFVISHSGMTKSIYDLVRFAKTKGVIIICITNYPMSKIAKKSDIVILTAVFEKSIRNELVSKRITQLCILETIYINVLMKKNELLENLDTSNEALLLNKMK